MRRAAVLGKPIRHSLSPLLHRTAYAALGLDWRYDAVECDESALADVLAGLDDSWVGLSLTMPLKEAVLPLLDEVAPEADVLSAVNTVLLREGRRYGLNTDVDGLAAALREAGAVPPAGGGTAVVLGAG
ncbi:MAG: shikimate dehydrogenase, partial [Acidothermales bacterium]|nr:shikimate dehydrogenase [Acidothermales bacterium]